MSPRYSVSYKGLTLTRSTTQNYIEEDIESWVDNMLSTNEIRKGPSAVVPINVVAYVNKIMNGDLNSKLSLPKLSQEELDFKEAMEIVNEIAPGWRET
jgi:hypothetical protein